MPVIRCPKCGQAYDVPGVVAARLPNSIATCHCGEWLAGSKAAVLARMLDPAKIKEVDLQPYRIDNATADARDAAAPAPPPGAATARSIRIVALGADQSIDTTFTIRDAPLLIGARGSHIVLPNAGLSIRHTAIGVSGGDIVLRDLRSQAGTFLDGKRVDDAVITEGVHLLQIGGVRLAVEPTDETGLPVEPIDYTASEADEREVMQDIASREEAARSASLASSEFASPFSVEADTADTESTAEKAEPEPEPPPTVPTAALRTFLVCAEGPLSGQEFEVPPTGLIVGREGHVRVPDEFLSRRHFQVAPDAEGSIRVRDLGSRNGTFLNSAPAQDTLVNPGDEIRAGVNVFRIERR